MKMHGRLEGGSEERDVEDCEDRVQGRFLMLPSASNAPSKSLLSLEKENELVDQWIVTSQAQKRLTSWCRR